MNDENTKEHIARMLYFVGIPKLTPANEREAFVRIRMWEVAAHEGQWDHTLNRGGPTEPNEVRDNIGIEAAQFDSGPVILSNDEFEKRVINALRSEPQMRWGF